MRFLLVLTLMVVPAGVPRSEPSFLVVVHRSNPVSSLTRVELSTIMMKRTRRWPDGEPVVPVDRRASAPLRDDFSKAVHGKSTAYVVRYWQRLIFSGRAVPPRELDGNEAVIAFVEANRGAIGYVSRDAEIDERVKVVAVME